MILNSLYFVYGLCIMFDFMMVWSFLRKNNEFLSKLVAALMGVVGLQCIKDLVFLSFGDNYSEIVWMTVGSLDMVAVPFYTFILIELCRPGWLTLKTMLLHELPFIVLPIVFLLTHNELIYYANAAYALLYGFVYAVWTTFAIPKYHKLLKEQFSYDDNINLNWLRTILFSFFVLLGLWGLDCFVFDFGIETIYMFGSLIIWMMNCYFLYKHESIILEVQESAIAVNVDDEIDVTDDLQQRIEYLFEVERIFLNPHLKLSDVAAMTNSNRTYISRVFNNTHGKSFFEFVNEYRVRYAMQLLKSSGDTIEVIAEKCGFNSRQAFQRVFSKITGSSPSQFRLVGK